MTDATPWYETAFERGYLEVYPHRDLASAREEIAGLVAGGLGRLLGRESRAGAGADTTVRAHERARVLDLGCGFGRHTLALAGEGFEVVGVDLSLDLLRHAPRVDGSGRLAGRLFRGDFRHLPFASASFDALLMLFSSFGYFDDRANAAVLGEVARVLAPGGTAVLDLMNAARIRATLVPESVREEDGRTLHERRSLSDDGRRVRKEVELTEDGATKRWTEDVRLYDPPEIEALLAAAGLALERIDGDFDGRPLSEATPRAIVWARRRP